jgi:hypothetical protein
MQRIIKDFIELSLINKTSLIKSKSAPKNFSETILYFVSIKTADIQIYHSKLTINKLE